MGIPSSVVKDIEAFISPNANGDIAWDGTTCEMGSRSPTPRTRRFRQLQADLEDVFKALNVRILTS